MEYLYSENANYEDYASGRVIYGGKGIPNFPVRLLNEIFGRARSYLEKKTDLTVYDPCCGGGYSLTVLGFFHGGSIARLCGSDVDAQMVQCAQKNTALLTRQGLEQRRAELAALYDQYQKASHAEALESIKRLGERLEKEVRAEIFQADCTGKLPEIWPDIIVTDVPYGNLVEWKDQRELSIDDMLRQLAAISRPGAVLAVCMDKKQKVSCDYWRRVEKQSIGKRKFEILIRN